MTTMPGSDVQLLLVVIVAASTAMLVTWFVQRQSGNAGIVDLVWTVAVGLASLLYACLGSGDPTRRLLVALFAGLWSARLAWHLGRRIIGKPEDGRYRALREHWGEGQQRGLFLFFQAQALFVVVFSLPQWVVAQTPTAPAAWQILAAFLIWSIALVGESVADAQLDAFKRRPEARGRTCREGLWRYSRHPNYFFEWLGWFVWPVLAWPGGLTWLALLTGPVLMYLFLARLTGIPYTEGQALKSRADYADYQQTTSAFFPRPPRAE
jgi:steroid 5-alpha reductase family enzyme